MLVLKVCLHQISSDFFSRRFAKQIAAAEFILTFSVVIKVFPGKFRSVVSRSYRLILVMILALTSLILLLLVLFWVGLIVDVSKGYGLQPPALPGAEPDTVRLVLLGAPFAPISSCLGFPALILMTVPKSDSATVL